MSDEPQPQQPDQGWAPREPQAADPVVGQGDGRKPKRPRRTGWRRMIPTWRMVLGTFVIGILLLIGLFYLGYSMVNIPRPTPWP